MPELMGVYERGESSVSESTNLIDSLSVLLSDVSERLRIAFNPPLLKAVSGYHHFRAKVRCQSGYGRLRSRSVLNC